MNRIWLAALVFAVSQGAYAGSSLREMVDVQPLKVFGTGEMTNGAVILTRDFVNGRLNGDVSSTGLEPDVAYSIWWVIFNFPKHCAKPYACAGSDIGGSPKAQASAIWGGGFVADQFGTANASLGLVKGPTVGREILAGSDAGLINLQGGEIHVVLRSHGPVGVAGSVDRQIGTANDACPPAGCMNKFFSVHKAKHP